MLFRSGGQVALLEEGSLVRQIYGADQVVERHRHRYEVNNQLAGQLSEAGLRLSGHSPNEQLVEMVELPGHPWFVGCQFHPEFTSSPRVGHPLFKAFIEAAIARQTEHAKQAVAA